MLQSPSTQTGKQLRSRNALPAPSLPEPSPLRTGKQQPLHLYFCHLSLTQGWIFFPRKQLSLQRERTAATAPGQEVIFNLPLNYI